MNGSTAIVGHWLGLGARAERWSLLQRPKQTRADRSHESDHDRRGGPPSAPPREPRRRAGHATDREHMHGSRDVLKGLLPEVTSRDGQLADYLVESGRGKHDAARLGQAFESGRDVDAVAVRSSPSISTSPRLM